MTITLKLPLTKEQKAELDAKVAAVVTDTSLYTPSTRGGTPKFKPYYKFTCKECGKEDENTFSDDYYYPMVLNRLCFYCCYYHKLDEKMSTKHLQMTIIDGHIYTPGNRTTGPFRGMAGRRFDIEYIEPSIYAGQKITTFDLWSGSTMPEWIAKKYPNTAKFLGQAEKVTLQGETTTCWNPSDGRLPPYPLPNTLKPNPT